MNPPPHSLASHMGVTPFPRRDKAGPNPSGLCMCGCGETTRIAKESDKRTGRVKGTHTRYVKGHERVKGPPYAVDPDTGCWIWQRTIKAQGYGALQRDGRELSAHRFYYEQHVGPIPAGTHLHHLCHVRACVNPAHLEPVTAGTHVRLHARLTADDVKEIRASNEPPRVLAPRYGINPVYVWRVRNEPHWTDEANAA